MKHIKLIETLGERAMRNGEAVHNRRTNYHDYGLHYFGSQSKAPMTEVYRIEYSEVFNVVRLYHYGTKTCAIDLSNNEITYIYGESRSDVDSIYTFIYYFTGKHVSIGYKHVNGGFYVTTPETTTRGGEVDGWIDIFYDDNPTQFLSSVNYGY